jgi:hypothetical protein
MRRRRLDQNVAVRAPLFLERVFDDAGQALGDGAEELVSGSDDLVGRIAVVALVAIGRTVGAVVAPLPAVTGLVVGIRRRTVGLSRPAIGLRAGVWRSVGLLLRPLRVIGRPGGACGRTVGVVPGRRIGRGIGRLLLGRRGHRPQDQRQQGKQAFRQRAYSVLCEHGSIRGLVGSPLRRR